jgi:hypothetical protein
LVTEKRSTKKPVILVFGVISGIIVLLLVLFAFFKFLPKNIPSNPQHEQIKGIAVINSSPPGAEIFLDNNNLGIMTPAILESLMIGEHQIELRKRDYKPISQKFEIKGNDTVSLNITLELEVTKTDTGTISKPVKPKPLPPSTGTGYLKIKVIPWAKIYIDGQYIETTPIARVLSVNSGVHILRLENPNFKIWQRNIRFAPEDTVNLNVRLEPLEGALRLIVKPWADVYIDGKFYETTPIAKPIRIPSGRHILKLINPSFKPYEEVIVIEPNQVLKKNIELQSK